MKSRSLTPVPKPNDVPKSHGMEAAVFSRQPSRVTGRSAASDSRSLLASGDMRVYALLAQQLQAAADVIELNKAITRSLDTYKPMGTSGTSDCFAPYTPGELLVQTPRLTAADVCQSTESSARADQSTESIAQVDPSRESTAHFGESPESIAHVGQNRDSTTHFREITESIDHVGQSTDSTDRFSRNNLQTSEIRKPLLANVPDGTASISKSMQLWQGFRTSAKSFLSMGDDGSIAPYRKRRRRLVLAAANKAKDRIVATASDYNVEDLYFEEGCTQAIARSAMFQNATQLVIIVNALWMGIDTDWNHAQVLCDASLIFQIMDNLFCAYFSFELAIRFLAFERKVYATRDFWFVSDALLVLLTIWETWIQTAIYLISGSSQTNGSRSASVLRLFRALRLLRISRFARILRMMPELFILIKSIGTAMRCMAVTLSMLIMIIYIFSIIFVQLMAGTPTGKGHFDNVPQAMNFMLTSVLCGFDADFINLLLADSFLYYVLWLFYVLLGSLSIMNVLIGILCEVVSGTADEEKELALKNDVMTRIIRTLGFNPKVPLGKEEMMETLDHSDVCEGLEEIGIDVDALLDFVQFFEDTSEMYLDDFVDVIVNFRGYKPTNVNDMLNVRKFITMEVNDLGRAIKTKKARPESATANE